MPAISIRAHFDGERIRLDEPFDIPQDTPLLVTILMPEGVDDRAAWIAMSRQTLDRAYGTEEPEYTLADLRR